MKRYSINYTYDDVYKLNLNIANSSASNVCVKEANNIKELFFEFKTKEEHKGKRILWIEEIISPSKKIMKFNVFFYVDKKTGQLQGAKLIYDMKKGGYINPNLSIWDLLKAKKFSKAKRIFINKFRPKFNHYRAEIEKYCIRNNFLEAATVINNSWVSEKVKIERIKANFVLSDHLAKYDETGATVGCGCTYCRIHKKLADMKGERQVAFDTYMLHRNYHVFHKDFFFKPGGEYFINQISMSPCGEKRFRRIFNQTNRMCQHIQKLERQVKIDCQIPNKEKLCQKQKQFQSLSKSDLSTLQNSDQEIRS
jgi:hypothetical protein